MPVLRELITVLGFDVDDAAAARAEQTFDGLKKGALAVVGATVAITAALALMVKETITAGDEAATTGERLGITAKEVQELSFAAERSGVPIAQLNQGLRSLQRRAADSIGQVNEFAKGFAALGVRVTDANGKLKPTVELLGEVATAFQGITDEGQRTALAMKVAGDGGAALLPLFLQGAKGIDALRQRASVLGFVLDTETIEASSRLADNFDDLRLLFLGVSRRIARTLLPLVERLTGGMIDLFIANRELIDRGIKVFIDTIEGSIDAMKRFAGLIEENRRVLLLFAGVLFAAVLPGLLSVAGGYALVALAAIKTAIVAAAPFLAVIALAALVALALEDIFVFVSGGESAIGNLFKAFTEAAQKPDAHWMVQTLATIIEGVVDTINAIDDFFQVWQNQAIAGGGIVEGVVRTLKMAGEGIILFFSDVGKAIFKSISEALQRAVASIPLPKILLRVAGAGTLLGETFAGLKGGGPLPPPSGPSLPPARLPGGASSSPQVTIQGSQFDIRVEGAGGDPAEIANATAAAVDEKLQEQNRATMRELRGGEF